MSMGAPSAVLAPETSRQRPEATFLMTKAPVLASAVMFQFCAALPLQSWISTPVRLAVPPPTVPKHLLVLAFMEIFQVPEPVVKMANFCMSPPQLEYCWTLVPQFCEPLVTSMALPDACMGARP